MWQPTKYGEKGERGVFKFFSNLVSGKGDAWLRFLPSWISKHRIFWTKKIILKPIIDDENQTFYVAFWSEKHDKREYFTDLRTVEEGPFCMRLGPDDCEFFIVSKTQMKLEFVGYCRFRGGYGLY